MVCEQRCKMHEASLFKTPTSVAIHTLQLRGEYMFRGQENAWTLQAVNILLWQFEA